MLFGAVGARRWRIQQHAPHCCRHHQWYPEQASPGVLAVKELSRRDYFLSAQLTLDHMRLKGQPRTLMERSAQIGGQFLAGGMLNHWTWIQWRKH
jgi:hypothetical protein